MLIPKHTKTFQWEETAPPPMPRQYALMKPKPYDSKASKLWESPGVLLGSLGFSWVLLGSLGFSWVLLGSLGFSWYLLVSDGYGPVKSKDSGRHGVCHCLALHHQIWRMCPVVTVGNSHSLIQPLTPESMVQNPKITSICWLKTAGC